MGHVPALERDGKCELVLIRILQDTHIKVAAEDGEGKYLKAISATAKAGQKSGAATRVLGFIA
jgi:hypothetical protein